MENDKEGIESINGQEGLMGQDLELKTGDRVLEVLASVCRTPLEAFNQFIENSVDGIKEAEISDGVIHVELLRAAGRGRRKVEEVIVRDNGIGMSKEKLEKVAQSFADSEKIYKALRGEKGIGILAFALLCDEVHIASSDRDGQKSHCLVLKKDWLRERRGRIEDRCPHSFESHGTVVHLKEISPEVADRLTKESLKRFLGAEYANDLANNAFGIQIRDGVRYEPIEPKRFIGIEIVKDSIKLGPSEKAYIELFGLARDSSDAHVTLLGRAGSRICTLGELEDFNHKPWLDRRLEGYVRFDKLQRSADKKSVRVDYAYDLLVRALQTLEPKIQEALDQISSEAGEKELKDILNQVRLLVSELARSLSIPIFTDALAKARQSEEIGIIDPIERVVTGIKGGQTGPTPTIPKGHKGDGQEPIRSLSTPELVPTGPPEDKRELRSWYDSVERIIYVNEEHRDFLEARQERPRCARYLTHIWIKEAMLLQHEGNSSRLSDEMVGVISRAEALFNKYFR